MMPFVLAVLFVVIGTLAYVALRNAQDFSDANEIIPGVDTGAPKAWAGAHSPEARLHRRLRDAMEALRANTALDDIALADVRTQLEQHAVATDQQLVAAAALPKGQREQPVDDVAATVEAIEEAVASMVALRGPAASDPHQGIEDVRTRLRLVAEARAELAGLEAGGGLPELRDRLQAEPGGHDADDEPRPEPPPPNP